MLEELIPQDYIVEEFILEEVILEKSILTNPFWRIPKGNHPRISILERFIQEASIVTESNSENSRCEKRGRGFL